MTRLPVAVESKRRTNLYQAIGWVLSVVLFASPALAQTPPGDCPGFADVVEGESCGSQINSGCDSPNGQFTEAACGDLVCATTWADNGFRDIDWYRLEVQDDNDSGSDEYVLQFHSSVPLLAHVKTSCFDPPVEIEDCTFDPATGEWIMEMVLCAPKLSELLIRVQPGFQGSGPILDGIPCVGGGSPYYFTVTCSDDCDEPLCPECVRAPEGMVAWWMMDEEAGVTSSVDVVGNHNVTHNGGVIPGVSGAVQNGLLLDGISGHLRTPDAAPLNFESGDDFTLMGWIKADGGASGTRILFSKFNLNGSPVGWSLGLLNDNRLSLLMRDQSGGSVLASSTSPVPADRWVHVAVSIDRDSPTGIRFYINGSGEGTADPTSAADDLVNSSPLYLGALEDPNGLSRFFDGGLDEMIIVDFPMSSDSIMKIAEAGCGGFCRQRFHVTRFTPFCDGATQTVAAITIFNDLDEARSFELFFDGVPANGTDCDIDGPVTFVADTQNPIEVPALGQREIKVTITKPQGMVEDAESGCWRGILKEAGRVEDLEIRRGFVIQSNSICVEPLGLPMGVQAIPIGEITPFEFAVHNTTPDPYELMWKIRAVDSVSGIPNELLRLNMEEPGDPVLGMINIQGNGTELVTVDAEWMFTRNLQSSSTKGKVTDVIMYEDPGKIEPDQGLGSKGGEATERSLQTDCDPSDVDCDGDVDVDDLLELLSNYGDCEDPADCPGDTDADGDVDVDDLLALLAVYNS